MNRIMKQLELEEKILKKQIATLESKASLHPLGSLHVSKSNGTDQYYIYSDEEDDHTKVRKYLKKKDRNLAASIAQRDYEGCVLMKLKEREYAVRNAISVYEQSNPGEVLGRFPLAKQALIKPMFLTKEEYINKWLSVRFEGKKFQDNTPEIYTAKGERVCSKSEKIIADTLYRFGVPYRYEYPLELQGPGIIYPDFLVLNAETGQEFFWEHLGRMDDPEYVKEALSRIRTYEKNNYLPGQELILTSETKTIPLDMKVLDNVIHRYLM